MYNDFALGIMEHEKSPWMGDIPFKVNSVQEACAKCFVVHILKFEILQTTWKNKTKNIKMLDLLVKNWKLRVWRSFFSFFSCDLQDFKFYYVNRKAFGTSFFILYWVDFKWYDIHALKSFFAGKHTKLLIIEEIFVKVKFLILSLWSTVRNLGFCSCTLVNMFVNFTLWKLLST